MIEKIAKKRMKMIGLTQAKVAETAGCSPTQMGMFLKGTGFLNKESLEKCMALLGIDIEIYDRRYNIAVKTASILKGYSTEEILSMPKNEMIEVTGIKEISSLIEVTEEELDNIVSYGIVDHEGTYPYFKATVLHLIEVGEELKRSKVEKSFTKLLSLVGIKVLGLAGNALGVAIGMLLGDESYKSFVNNAMAPLMILAKEISKI